jgi:hypothetical protein
MKIKKVNTLFPIFLLAVSFFAITSKSSLADSCSTKNPGFACVDTGKVTGTSGCKTGLCPGSAAVKCCSLSSVTCKTDGSSALQPCSANGNYGACNIAGICADTGAGKISTTATDTSQSTNFTGGGTNFTNPLKFTTVEGFLGGILSAIQRIIVVLALVFIVIGSVMILTSAGDSGMVEKGKKAITMSLIGFAIGIAAPSLLKELSNLVGWGGAGEVASALTLTQIAMNVLNFLLGSMGIVALVMMVIGGIMYLTSAGNEDSIDRGKKIFKYSLIGVLMAMISMVLVTQIAKFFQ